MSENHKKSSISDFFLPDFCQTQSVFMVVLIAELLAVMLTVFNIQPNVSLWSSLGLYSISIQVVMLFSVACLCLLRSWLANYNNLTAGIISLMVILLSTLGFSFAVISWYWWYPIDLSMPLQSYFILRNLLVSTLIGSATLRYFYLQSQYRKQVDLEASSRLQALQARIRPHFLFNSMNVIASLTQIDPNKAERAIEDLSDLFRVTFENKEDLIPFSVELQNSNKYLSIEKLRLGKRLIVEQQIEPETLPILLPPLSVQPLLENAVYHGIQMLPTTGYIMIKSKLENNFLIIEISNPKPPHSNHRGNGMALNNISQRLEMIYSGKAALKIQNDEHFYEVTMQIPIHSKQR